MSTGRRSRRCPARSSCSWAPRASAPWQTTLIAAGKDPATPVCVTQSGATAAQRSGLGHARDDCRRRRGGRDRLACGDRDRRRRRAAGRARVGRAAAAARPAHRRHPRPGAGQRPRRRACATWARRSTSAPSSASSRSPARRSTRPATGSSASPRPNAPRLLLERCGGDARALAGVAVAAIGPGTAAALREVGIVADVVAERSLAEGLLEALPADLRGSRALVARAEEARDTLPEGLRAAGAEVDVVPLYRTLGSVPRHPERMLAADAVAFTSSSTVSRFAEALAGHDLSGVRGVSIGPVTSATARELGVGLDRGGGAARSGRPGRRAAAGSCRNLPKPDRASRWRQPTTLHLDKR